MTEEIIRLYEVKKMKNVCVFDTSYGSTNIGDSIIMESFYNEMSYLLSSNYVLKLPTHYPITHFYQDIELNPVIRWLSNCDYKFIGGSNILLKNMFLPLTQWNINIFNCNGYKNSVVVGCGVNPNSKKINLYTKLLYKKILSKDVVHSVRDENAKKFLEDLGYKAINTGCPTFWSFTKDFCKQIKIKKSKNVVFTITDYNKDEINDKKMINILKENYNQLYFFPQGAEDYNYFKKICKDENIKIVNPNLASLKEILENGNVDYVGTRLHAGIYSLKHKVRSIIIIIDNRAKDIKETYNIVAIDRNNIENLRNMINSEFETKINVDIDKIEMFKKQFED